MTESWNTSAPAGGRSVPGEPRVLVTGSRDFTDPSLVDQCLDAALALLQMPLSMQSSVKLIHGAAKGLDSIAGQVASRRGWAIESHPAQWDKHTAACPAWHVTPEPKPTCKMAGHRRNHEMIALGADVVLAFPLGIEASGHSRGTWGCARAAMAAQLPTLVLWNGALHPWGAETQRLVLSERRASHGDPSPSAGGPVRLGSLSPLPF